MFAFWFQQWQEIRSIARSWLQQFKKYQGPTYLRTDMGRYKRHFRVSNKLPNIDFILCKLGIDWIFLRWFCQTNFCILILFYVLALWSIKMIQSGESNNLSQTYLQQYLASKTLLLCHAFVFALCFLMCIFKSRDCSQE